MGGIVMVTADHPDIPFVEAAGYTRGRPDGPPLWIVFHDMEAGEHSLRAENTAAYFANPGDGRRVSAHYSVDDNSVVQSVRLRDSAWTVGNRPGNLRGINWELSGFARQTRAEWLDPFGKAMFAQMREICLRDMAEYGIPVRWLTDDQVEDLEPGMTTHNQLRLVFGGTTHTDPGPNFPYDFVLALFQEDEVAFTEEDAKLNARVLLNTLLGGSGPTVGVALQSTYGMVKALPPDLTTRLDAILAAAEDDGDATVVLPPEAITFFTDLRAAVDALPDAVADEQHARQAE